MRQSKVELYAHLVWATKGRMDALTGGYERRVYRCVVAEARQLGCDVLAIGGMPDHVHLLVRIPSTLNIAVLAQRVKGTSSSLMNELRPEFSDVFRWQSGYACFSVGRDEVDTVVAYVLNQKQHHGTDGQLWPEWEETDMEAPAPSHSPRPQDARPQANETGTSSARPFTIR
jgi:REP element-mobilizing transposase RayT